MDEDDKTPGPDTPKEVAEVVRHTDSGSGSSQAERWPPNVEGPEADEDEHPARPLGDAGSI